jgi:hypothetical protein
LSNVEYVIDSKRSPFWSSLEQLLADIADENTKRSDVTLRNAVVEMSTGENQQTDDDRRIKRSPFGWLLVELLADEDEIANHATKMEKKMRINYK